MFTRWKKQTTYNICFCLLKSLEECFRTLAVILVSDHWEKSTKYFTHCALFCWTCAERAWQWRQGKASLAVVSPATASDVDRWCGAAYITANYHRKQVLQFSDKVIHFNNSLFYIYSTSTTSVWALSAVQINKCNRTPINMLLKLA